MVILSNEDQINEIDYFIPVIVQKVYDKMYDKENFKFFD